MTELGEDARSLEQQIAWMAADLEATRDHAMAAAVVGVILRLFARHARGDGPRQDSPRSRLAATFVESIDTHIDRRSVAWHAHRIGASTRSVARATTEVLGRPPKDVIDERVILEARRRLAWSSEDISTIARALGFSEASNFTKFFRTRTGAPPSAFREAVDDMNAPHDRSMAAQP